MQMTRVVVIGAGQAGLSMSRCLHDRGIEHVVLDRGRVGERWRSQRWDSFTLLSPNWQVRLPRHGYGGPEPEGFMTGAQIVAFLEAYARDAPVRTGVEVQTVTPSGHGWRVDTDQGVFGARQVVVATGDLDRPLVPELADALTPDLVQLHTCAYRNPQLLPDGAVLVVGSGPSGQQIADELARAGRSVHLAVGRHKAMPRRYRGWDAFWWMERMGMLTRTVESLPRRRPGLRTPNSVLAGGVEDLDVHRLARAGVALHGRLTAVAGTVVRVADDLAENTRAADLNADRFARSSTNTSRASVSPCPRKTHRSGSRGRRAAPASSIFAPPASVPSSGRPATGATSPGCKPRCPMPPASPCSGEALPPTGCTFSACGGCTPVRRASCPASAATRSTSRTRSRCASRLRSPRHDAAGLGGR
jgi:putative flavoprotein involved in K+ transport